jgi:phosphate transport system protein
MRYARSKYAGSEAHPPFWRFLRRFAKTAALDSQALFAGANAAPQYHPCSIAQESPVKPMSNHTMTAFDADLRAIWSEVIDMGDRVRKSVEESIAVLAHRNLEVAAAQAELDRFIDSRQREIETKVIETMARRQPLAVDLRELISAFHIVSDLERIGDLAKNICKRVLVMDTAASPKLLRGIEHVSIQVLTQLRLVLESYAERDSAKALSAWSSDKAIDAAHGSLLRELLTHMMEDPRNIVFCAHLLFCSKNLERIGDHVTNIAESVYYMVTGHRLNGDRPKAEDLSFLRLRSADGQRSGARG